MSPQDNNKDGWIRTRIRRRSSVMEFEPQTLTWDNINVYAEESYTDKGEDTNKPLKHILKNGNSILQNSFILTFSIP